MSVSDLRPTAESVLIKMDQRKVFLIAVLFWLSQMFHQTISQCTGSEKSVSGWKLQRHTYKTMMAKLGLECALVCRQEDRCQSINFIMSVGMCEFNDRTKEAARAEDFVPDPDSYYYRRDMKRVPLGSIPELPAETCKEIKASEGEVVSGKYWFSAIKPGRSVLAHCNMETGDIDECTASSPVCDVNATCTNTRGSYHCACKVGFSGDGKTCEDIDECTASSPVCHANATCTNTRGSYHCVCKGGYFGDGKICTAGLASSAILRKNNKYLTALNIWLQPVVQSKSYLWKRCWRASVDGWAASTFHSGCDNKGPTVTIIKVGQYIFGGYANVSWTYSCSWRYDSKAFLFSLVNKPGWAPVKLTQTRQHSSNRAHSTYSCSSYGPTFGGGHDIYISNYASSNTGSYTNLGHCYAAPSGYSYGNSFTQTFLAATYNFQPDEIETFYETT